MMNRAADANTNGHSARVVCMLLMQAWDRPRHCRCAACAAWWLRQAKCACVRHLQPHLHKPRTSMNCMRKSLLYLMRSHSFLGSTVSSSTGAAVVACACVCACACCCAKPLAPCACRKDSSCLSRSDRRRARTCASGTARLLLRPDSRHMAMRTLALARQSAVKKAQQPPDVCVCVRAVSISADKHTRLGNTRTFLALMPKPAPAPNCLKGLLGAKPV